MPLNPIQNLAKQLARLPGIGPKFAERLVFYLASQPKEYALAIAYALNDFSKKIKSCEECGNISESTLCPICSDAKRDKTKICVVESALEIIALEKTGQYKGLYHVLGGVIDPHRHVMPENLRIKQLVARISNRNSPPASADNSKKLNPVRNSHGALDPTHSTLPNIHPCDKTAKNSTSNGVKIEEIIIATNPNTEGDTTALYLVRVLAPLGVKITRLARGLPSGSELEYMDEATISSALAGRRNL